MGISLVPASLVQVPGSQCAVLWSYPLNRVSSVAISRNGDFALAASELNNEYTQLSYFSRGGVPLWKTDNTTTYSFWAQVTMAADGSSFSVGGPSYWAGLWGPSANRPLWTFPGYFLQRGYASDGYPIANVAISGDGQFVSIRTIQPHLSDTLFLLGTKSNGPLWYHNFSDANSEETSLAISYEGAYIATIKESILYFFSQRDNRTLWTAKTTGNRVAMSSSGDEIFAANSTSIALYSKNSNATIAKINLSSLIRDFDVSNDGSTLAIITGNQTSTPKTSVSVWDLPSARQLSAFPEPKNWVLPTRYVYQEMEPE